MMIAGLAVLALAMTGAVLLISDIVFGTTTTVIATAAVAVTFVVMWAALPLYRRAGLREEKP
jgi:hypothetical protein